MAWRIEVNLRHAQPRITGEAAAFGRGDGRLNRQHDTIQL